MPELRQPERVRKLGADVHGAVVLAPFSMGSMREYSVLGWRAIERGLLDLGYRVVIVSHNKDNTWYFSGTKILGASADRIAGVMLNAAVVVGNDSGMAHLAGLLQKPTIVLEGETNCEPIFSAYPRVTVLKGYACSGCMRHAPYVDGVCAPRCPSQQAISPASVIAAVDRFYFADITQGRAVIEDAKLKTLRDMVRATNHLGGDVAELGVYRGGSARLIAHYAPTTPLHLFDTFAGLPADDPGGEHKAGEFAAELIAVQTYLANPLAVYHVGYFPDTAEPDLRFRFVHVDCDLAVTVQASIEYFAPRMVSGGIMVFDDYGWHRTPGVLPAVQGKWGGAVECPTRYQAVVRF
jgi:hypothetical protein